MKLETSRLRFSFFPRRARPAGMRAARIRRSSAGSDLPTSRIRSNTCVSFAFIGLVTTNHGTATNTPARAKCSTSANNGTASADNPWRANSDW